MAEQQQQQQQISSPKRESRSIVTIDQELLLRDQIQELPIELTQNIVEYLCGNRNDSINKPNKETGHTPLMEAIHNGDISKIVTIVEVYAKYFGTTNTINSTKDDNKCYNMIQEEGDDDQIGEDPTTNASSGGGPLSVSSSTTFDINFQNNEGGSAVLTASALGKFHTVKYLIHHNGNVNVAKKDTGDTPLLFACSQYYYSSFGGRTFHQDGYDIVNHLIENCNADVNLSYRSGLTPLHIVCRRRGLAHCLLAKLLIENGANVNATDFYDNTPLHNIREPSIAKLLLRNGANIEATNHGGQTPLHKACSTSISGRINKKVEQGGGSGYNIRRRKGNFEIAKFLINFGANLDAVDKHNLTPLDRAYEISDASVVKLLLQKRGRKSMVTASDKHLSRLNYTPGPRHQRIHPLP